MREEQVESTSLNGNSLDLELAQQIQEVKNLLAENNRRYQSAIQENSIKLKAFEQRIKTLEDFKNRLWIQRIKNFWSPKLNASFLLSPRQLLVPESYHESKVSDVAPLISIVTPSFDQGKYIEKTVKSVLDQKYPCLEYIIQDGDSKDETVEIVQRYAAQLKHWESKKDGGQSQAINLGFKHATGEIMAYLNSDDMLLPGALHYIANFFKQNPDVDVVYGHRVLINEHDQEIGRWVLPPHDNAILSWADYIPQETLFWRRRIWDKAGGKIDEDFRFAMDWDLLLRFRDAGAKFVRLPRFLGAFRVHQNQKTSAQISEIGNQEMQRLRYRCHQRDVTSQEIRKHTIKYLFKHVICQKLYRANLLKY